MAVKDQAKSQGRKRAWEKQRRELYLGQMIDRLLTDKEREILMRRIEAILRGEEWQEEHAIRTYGGRP